jgi:hypothetical protein
MNCLELGALFIECIKRPHIDKKDKIKCKPEFDAYTECVKMNPPILILNMERNINKN